MDLSTIITGIVMLMLFIVPIILNNLFKKRKYHTIVSKMKSLATKNNSVLSSYDIQPGFAIGISKAKDYIFFVDHAENKDNGQDLCIPLKKIEQCILHREERTVKVNKCSETIIDKISLIFKTNNSNKDSYDCTLYNTDESLQLENEIVISKKWVSIVNNAIKAA